MRLSRPSIANRAKAPTRCPALSALSSGCPEIVAGIVLFFISRLACRSLAAGLRFRRSCPALAPLLPMSHPNESAPNSAELDAALLDELARLIVSALNLDIKPEQIRPDDALYGAGLGLDSIDILEVALAVSKRFGVQLRADNENNVVIFRSLRSLAEFVAANRSA